MNGRHNAMAGKVSLEQSNAPDRRPLRASSGAYMTIMPELGEIEALAGRRRFGGKEGL